MYINHGASLLRPEGAPPSLRLPHKPTLTFINSASVTADGTSHDFGTFAVARPGLLIAAGGGHGGALTPAVTSVTIGGSAARLHVANPTSDRPALGLASRKVGSGSINVTFGFDATSVRGMVGVWLLTGYASAEPDDVDESSITGDVTSRAATLTIRPNGVAVYVAVMGHNTAGLAISWSDATERFDSQVETFAQFAGADYSVAGAHTETASWSASGTTALAGIVGACWH